MKTIKEFLTTQINIEPVDSVYAPNPMERRFLLVLAGEFGFIVMAVWGLR